MTKIWMAVYCLLTIPHAFGQAPDASGADLSRNVQTGMNVTVRLTDGRQLRGTVLEASSAQVGLATKQGRESIPAANIREVSRRRNDPLWEGLIIGSLAGAVLGVVSNTLNDCDPHECGEKYVVAGGLALGAAVGIGIDALWREKQILYRSAQSSTRVRIQVIAGKVTAARISWRF